MGSTIEPVTTTVVVTPYQGEPNVRKTEMLAFGWHRPEVWLSPTEHYFALHQMSKEAKVHALRVCLIGSAPSVVVKWGEEATFRHMEQNENPNL